MFRYINVEVWRELLSLFAAHNFKINERILLAVPVPCLKRQQRRRAMVAMRIHRPMREDDIRLLPVQEFLERFTVGVGNLT